MIHDRHRTTGPLRVPTSRRSRRRPRNSIRTIFSWVDEDDADEDRGADEDETSAMESSDADPATAGEEASAEDGLEEQFEREEEWRETRRIPSIDPENSEAVSDSSAGGREAKPDRSSPDRSSSEQSSNPADTSAADAPSNDARADSQDSAAAETSTASAAAASGPRTGRSQDPESERSRVRPLT